MTVASEYPQIRTVGLDGVIVVFAPSLSDAANRAALSFRAAIDALGWPDIEESASTLVSAYFRIDLVDQDPEAVMDRLRTELAGKDWYASPLPAGRKIWTIPAAMGGTRGPQLGEFCELADISEAQARSDIAAADLRVLTLGFAPGTPYLGDMPTSWNVPRQTALSKSIPRGALVSAVQQVILFSKTSPTGWRHIGQTAFQGFQPDAKTPILLRPGDHVRFVDVTEAELARIEALGDPLGGAKSEPVS